MDITLKLTDEQQRIVELWSELYTAFNHISVDAKTNKTIVSGGDYSDDLEFNSATEALEFITNEVKNALLFYAMEGDADTLRDVCSRPEDNTRTT